MLISVPRLELGGLTGTPLPVESPLVPGGAAGSGPAIRPSSMPQGFGSDFGMQSVYLARMQAHVYCMSIL